MRKSIIIFIILCMLGFLSFSVNAGSPQITDVHPSNGAIDQPLSVNLSANLSDPDGDMVYFIFKTNKSGTWEKISDLTVTYIPNGTYTTTLSGLDYNTKYWWKLNVKDEQGNWNNKTFIFTTVGDGNGGGEEPDFSGEITIFPDSPTSGEMFAVILDNRVSTSGYVWVGGKLFYVIVTNGFGTVQTDDNVYGDAYIWLYGENASSSLKKTFTIQCGLEGTLSLDAPESVKVNEVAEINITMGGEPVADAEVLITDPFGYSITLHTNENGKVTQIMDKVGDWLIRCTFLSQNALKEVNVEYKQLEISVSNDEHIIGDDVRIDTEEDAIIEITKDGVLKFQSTALNGVLVFTPNEPGAYRATGTIGNKRGTVDFDVFQRITIKVFDLNNMQISKLEAGTKYLVKVVDDRDRPVSDFDEVYYGYGETISLNGGFGFWTPMSGGTTELYLDDIDGFLSNTLNVLVEGGESEFEINWVGIIIVIVIIVGVLLYAFRDKLPDRFKRIFGKGLRSKREVPI